MVQASRGCSELLKFFSLSLKSAAIKGSPSCNVIWKATRTVRSWTSTLLEHKIPWRKFKITSTTSLTSRKQGLNCYLRLPTKKFDCLADVRLALAGIIRSIFHYSVSCWWLYQLAASKCQAFSQLSQNTREEWTCIRNEHAYDASENFVAVHSVWHHSCPNVRHISILMWK